MFNMKNIILLLFFCVSFSKIDCQISLAMGIPCEISYESRDEVNARVLNGNDTSAKLAPWHAVLEHKEYTNPDQIVSYCGGNILSRTIILTAAHCVWSNLPHWKTKRHLCPTLIRNQTSARECHELPNGCPYGCFRVRPEDLNVYVGVTSIRQPVRTPLKVKNIILHPGWNKKTFREDSVINGHDLALIILENELQQFNSTTVRNICLPSRQQSFDSGLKVIINGFGHTDIWEPFWATKNITRNPAKRLQQGLLQIKTTGDCAADFDAYYNKSVIQGDQLCAYSDKTDSCKGDSGGGLISFEDSHSGNLKVPLLIGIVSFGTKNCTDLPGVYTNVKTHMEWIQQISRNSTVTEETHCRTTSINEGGSRTNARCIFPFTHKGVTYTECPFHKKLKDFWCSTKVDSSGKHLSGQGEWGICGPYCPLRKTEETHCRTTSVKKGSSRTNARCIFPFTHKGVTYTECPFHKKLKDFWCSTKVDSSGNHLLGQEEWGICGPYCPLRKTGGTNTIKTSTTTANTRPKQDCEVGDEYENNCYLLVETPLDWLSAFADCKDRNGTLVNINDAGTNAFIANNITNGVQAWISTNEEVGTGNDGEIIGSFIGGGIGSLSTRSFTSSYITFPGLIGSSLIGSRNQLSEEGRCVYINFKSPGKWSTDYCESALPYVCEGQMLLADVKIVLRSGKDPLANSFVPKIRYRSEVISCLPPYCQVGDKCCPLQYTTNGYQCPPVC